MTRLLAELGRVFHVLPTTLALVWSASKKWTSIWVAVLLLQALMPVAAVLLLKRVVDALVALLGQEADLRDPTSLVFFAALLAAILILTEGLQIAGEWLRLGQAELVKERVADLIHRKAVSVDYAFYESPDYFDRLQQATTEGTARALGITENTGALLQGGLTLITLAAILVPYSIWFPLVLALAAFPSLWVLAIHNRRHQRWWRDSTPTRRKATYADYVLTRPDYAGELRLYELTDHFVAMHAALRKELREAELDLVRKRSLAQMSATLTSSAAVLGSLFWMGVKVLNGSASLGDVALFHQAFTRGQAQLRTTMRSVGQLYANVLFLELLHEFLAIEPALRSPENPAPIPARPEQAIRISSLEFRYPGSDRPVFSDFDLEIPAGKLVAIVGKNGAGKSTLCKLLARLFDPQTGRIEIDGTDIRQFDLEEYRRHITILSQIPTIYVATVEENIGYGDLSRSDDHEAIVAAAHAARAAEFIESLPSGFATSLGKSFAGGTDLSVGQWQRLALARACLRDSPIVVLDEPTSFMDPWAETRWLAGVRHLLEGKTAVMITHRFTTARLADKIFVLDEGRILEEGSHEQLLELGGAYAESWLEQEQVRLKD